MKRDPLFYLVIFCCFLLAISGFIPFFYNGYGPKSSKQSERHFQTVRIDGCEYILMKGYGKGNSYETNAGGLTHKANCDNQIHKK